MSSGSLALLAGWGLWCALHSLLVANVTTGFFRKFLGRGFRFYRLAYGLFSFGTLVPLIRLSATMDRTVILAWEGYYRLLPAAGFAAAALLFIAGARRYDLAELLGVRQMITGTTHRALSQENHLDTSGILGVVRHPWYVATFLLLWSWDLTHLGIQVNMLLSAYLVVGTLLEERKLVEEFGVRYLDYQRRVSMFFPVKWLLTKAFGRSDER